MTAVRWWLSDAWVVTLRHLRRIPRQPEMIIFGIVQPILFIVLFRYLFGGALAGAKGLGAGGYAQFLLPGVFVQTVVFGAVAAAAIGTAEDMQKGLMDRFRSLPMSRSSVLLGRTFSDTVRNSLTVAVMIAVGFLVGFRFLGSPLEAVAGVALLLLFGFSLSWIAVLIGLSVGSVEAAQGAGMIWLFPLTFASSAFVPPETMPGWLRAFVEVNPVTVTVNTLRALFGGTPAGSAGWQMAAWMAGLIAVFLPLSVLKFRRTSA
ncbi:MAG TPA: ABC transporter permease [Mycobacteriales bacterium]|jgi:ABC-2 type transport system permease protein/oleandomycin transport system permease protein